MARSKDPRGWHGEDIRAEIRKRHGTVLAFAKKTAFTLSAICRVLNGQFIPGPARAVAEAIDRRPHVLWPQWFNPDDTPRLGRHANGSKSKAGAPRRHVQSRARAA